MGSRATRGNYRSRGSAQIRSARSLNPTLRVISTAPRRFFSFVAIQNKKRMEYQIPAALGSIFDDADPLLVGYGTGQRVQECRLARSDCSSD